MILNQQRHTRSFYHLVYSILLGIALSSCQDDGQADDTSLIIHGTWVSTVTFNTRGSFTMQGSASIQGLDGTLSGKLTFQHTDGSEMEEAVSGEMEKVINPGSTSYYTLRFKTAGDTVSFFGTVFGSVDSNTPMIGSYENGDDKGEWHSLVNDGVFDADIDQALETELEIQDLCYAKGSLFAVGKTAGTGDSAPALYQIDPQTGTSTLLTLTPACSQPLGIAWDATSFWVACAGEEESAAPGLQLSQYDASWQRVGEALPLSGMDLPSYLAWHDNKLWFANLLMGTVLTIDPVSGAISPFSALRLNRPAGMAFVGDRLWSASFPPGGVWGQLAEHDLQGTQHRTLYAPDNANKGSSALAVEEEHLWTANGSALFRLRP